MTRSLRRLALMVAVGVAWPCAASAQPVAEARRECERARLPVIITVEGGGSLGVYEAGMTYLLVEVFKRRWLGLPVSPTVQNLASFCLAVATGASAGNINSFLAAADWCDNRLSETPESSIYWTTWVSTGLTQLFPDLDGERERALFSRRHFDDYIQGRLRQHWSASQWIPGCRTHFGATVTRLYADSVRGAGGIYARSQRMAFALTLEGIREGAPAMRPFAQKPTRYSFSTLKSLRPDTSGYVAWQDAFTLIETSSGYPLAFQPLPISYCSYRAFDQTCTDTATALALDGGVFDNSPIALAYGLYYDQAIAATPSVLFLSPDHRRNHQGRPMRDMLAPTKASGAPREPHGLEEVVQLVREAIPTARQYEQQLAGQILDAAMRVQSLQDAQETLADSLMRLGGAGAGETDLATPAAIARLVCRYVGANAASIRRRHCVGGASATPAPSVSASDAMASAESLNVSGYLRRSGRWHPLSGDWVGGFGAFFGRPLRQYDFYVGMYDAVLFIAENILCAGAGNALASESAARSAVAETPGLCVATGFEALSRDTTLPLGPIARRLLPRLYDDEYRRSAEDSPPARTLSVPMTLDDSIFVVVDAVREAMYQARVKGARQRQNQHWYLPAELLGVGHCRRPGIVTGPFCANGVIAFFDLLHEDTEAFAILEAWSDDDSCDVERTEVALQAQECRVERHFVDLTKDPEGVIYSRSRQMLRRIEGVTPSGGGAARAASALLFTHGSSSDRYRRGFDMGSSTLPPKLTPTRRLLLHALPSSWGLTPNIQGWGEIGWEGRYHLWETPWAVALPVHLRPRSQIGTDGVDNHTLLVPGTRLEYTALPVNSRVGFQLDYWCRPHDGLGDCYKGATTGLFVSLAGKFNVSYTQIPGGLPLYRLQNSTIVTVGAGDLNGFAYWFMRFLGS